MSKKGDIYEPHADLTRPSRRAEPLDQERYNVRLELGRGTELSMNAKAAELGVRGPKGVIVYALMQLGVEVDARDKQVLRRMNRPEAPPTVAGPPPGRSHKQK